MTKCSQCLKLCGITDSYINNKTGEIWCMACLTKLKKERNKVYFMR